MSTVARLRYGARATRQAFNHRQVQQATRTLIDSFGLGPDFSSATCVSVGAEFWFPNKGAHGVEEKDAAKMCRGGVLSTGRRVGECPMRRACLERALEQSGEITKYGVWAGYTAKKLTRMRHLRRLIRAAATPREAPHAA